MGYNSFYLLVVQSSNDTPLNALLKAPTWICSDGMWFSSITIVPCFEAARFMPGGMEPLQLICKSMMVVSSIMVEVMDHSEWLTGLFAWAMWIRRLTSQKSTSLLATHDRMLGRLYELCDVGASWTPQKSVDHSLRHHKHTASPQCGCTYEFAVNWAE